MLTLIPVAFLLLEYFILTQIFALQIPSSSDVTEEKTKET